MFHVSILWLIIGVVIGFEATLLYGWLSLRRANRSRNLRWRVTDYTSRGGTWKPW